MTYILDRVSVIKLGRQMKQAGLSDTHVLIRKRKRSSVEPRDCFVNVMSNQGFTYHLSDVRKLTMVNETGG